MVQTLVEPEPHKYINRGDWTGCSCGISFASFGDWARHVDRVYMSGTPVTEGRKDDTGKVRFDLIPPGPLFKLAEVYTIGAKKYDDRNWEKGLQWGRVFAALMRHAWAWWRREKNDPVDGQHHLASVAWCAFALMEWEETHPELDDRS